MTGEAAVSWLPARAAAAAVTAAPRRSAPANHRHCHWWVLAPVHIPAACRPLGPSRSNLFEWAVTVLGPPDTLYEGGFFNAVLKFPKDYPQSPPEMRFTSEMW